MARSRMLFVDNVRLVLIALVVCHHAVMTYCDVGAWYYRDPVVPGQATSRLFLLFISFNQSFFMGTLFALAGYFAAKSLRKKGGPSFARGRLVRLGLPTLFFALVLNPVSYDWGLLTATIREEGGFWVYYAHYVTSLTFLSGTGPMWFALALLLFCLAYAGLRGLGGARRPAPSGACPLTPGFLVLLIGLCAVGTFVVRLAYPVGTAVCNLQLSYFVQYITLFIFGILAERHDWLRSMNIRTGRNCLLVASLNFLIYTTLVCLAYRPDLQAAGAMPHWLSQVVAMWSALWESISGVCMTAGLIVLFRERLNRQNALVAACCDSAFAVYVFHPPIMVILARLIEPCSLAALPKAGLLCALSLPACFAVAWCIRRVPFLRDMVAQ